MLQVALGSGDSRWPYGAGRGHRTVRPLAVPVPREAERPEKAFCVASCCLSPACGNVGGCRSGSAGD